MNICLHNDANHEQGHAELSQTFWFDILRCRMDNWAPPNVPQERAIQKRKGNRIAAD
jgi:hypothetical protein